MAAHITLEEALRRLGRAYGEGLDARADTSKLMVAAMNGEHEADAAIARSELAAVQTVRRATGIFKSWDLSRLQDDNEVENSEAAVRALEKALAAVGQWEDSSSLVAASSEELDQAVRYFAYEYENDSRLADAVPYLPNVRKGVWDDIPVYSEVERIESATKTALDYAEHRLVIKAGKGTEEARAHQAPASRRQDATSGVVPSARDAQLTWLRRNATSTFEDTDADLDADVSLG